LEIAEARGEEVFPNTELCFQPMVAANLRGMLQATTGGTHQHLNQLFVRSGTQGFQFLKHVFVWAMVTLCNACIALLIVAE
jgi:hypothetical protein